MHGPRCFLLLLMLQILNHAYSCCTHSPSRCYIKPHSHHMNCTRVLKMCEQTGTFTSHELEFANYAIQFAVSSANQYEVGRYVMTTRPVNAWSKGLFTTRELNSTARVSITTSLAAAKLERLLLAQFMCCERGFTTLSFGHRASRC